ncbi:unnamed protein product [Clonostachys chloroleuca]|uniref:Uncharacterized protein n=1 Tax=Clonostachys chloroleuca TaxID=1926264 RepID=A0AA35PY95_9HYPO|nr:unnamed protein product [Clonostachys chloroleuca]
MTLPTIQHPYYSNYQVSGHYLKGTDHDTYILINSTVIEDDDLTFDVLGMKRSVAVNFGGVNGKGK